MKSSIFISTNLSKNTGGGNVSKRELEALQKHTQVKMILANHKELDYPTVIAQVVNSPYSKYSYTECVFDYNGERHITNFRPCTAFVGEKLTVLVTSEGRVLDYSIQYKK